MNTISVFTPEMYTWVVLPLLIFSARVVDVSLDTIRILFISKRLKYLAPIIGFFEVLVWLMAMKQIMQNLDNVGYMFAYAAGFATGNFVGMYIEQLLSIGKVIIRIISKDCDGLIDSLRACGCGVTSIEAQGLGGPVKIIFSIINRADIAKVVAKIREFNPQAFYSLEDISSAREEISYGDIALKRRRFFDRLRARKKVHPIEAPCSIQEKSLAGSAGS